MKLVSIVMPCFNDGKYINESIKSVINQTYKNWELIIVDDGSDDELTKEILKEIHHDKIKVYETKHVGPAAARNHAISNSKGTYILPLDSDDLIESDYIEKAVKCMEKNEKIGVVYCYADLFGEKTGRWDLPNYSFESMLLDNVVFVTSLFYKKDWESVGGFNSSMKNGMEDYDFWLSILALGREIYQIPEVLFHYRIKCVSRTTLFQDNSDKVKKTYEKMYDNHKDFYKLHSEKYAKILREALIEQIFLRRKLEVRFEKISKLGKIPVLGSILRKLMKE